MCLQYAFKTFGGVRNSSPAIAGSPFGSANRRIYAGAYAPPFGTLLPSVATSYIRQPLNEIAHSI